MWWTMSLAFAGPPGTPIGGTVKAPPNVEIVPAVLESSVRLVFAGREGDEVLVDGWPAGPLPVLTQLAEGPHKVRVDGPKGRLELEVWITVTADQIPEINLAAPPPLPSPGAPDFVTPPVEPKKPS